MLIYQRVYFDLLLTPPEVCNLHDLSAPRIYILEHTDGAGHRMKLVPENEAVFD